MHHSTVEWKRGKDGLPEGWEPYDINNELWPEMSPRDTEKRRLEIDDEPDGMDFFG